MRTDTPGTVDYVLAPADMSEIDARLARMNEHIEQHALANGYAFFRISVLYDLRAPLDERDLEKRIVFIATTFDVRT